MAVSKQARLNYRVCFCIILGINSDYFNGLEMFSVNVSHVDRHKTCYKDKSEGYRIFSLLSRPLYQLRKTRHGKHKRKRQHNMELLTELCPVPGWLLWPNTKQTRHRQRSAVSPMRQETAERLSRCLLGNSVIIFSYWSTSICWIKPSPCSGFRRPVR
jgi:hypothetical protein